MKIALNSCVVLVEAALAVGFDDATSFSKAFRRWMRETPSMYQARSAPEARA